MTVTQVVWLVIRYIIVSETREGEIARPVPSEAGRQGGLTPEARAAFEAGIPANSKRVYRDTIERYRKWCADTGLGDLPATAVHLTEYATHMKNRGLSPGTIEGARWAIIKWHQLAGCEPPETAGLIAVLNGYRESLAEADSPKANPRKAQAAELNSLTAVLAAIDRAALAGQRDAAIILVGFGIGGRRSEIASLNIGSLDIRGDGMQIRVYRKKVKKTDDPVIKRRTLAAQCPVAAAEKWIASLAAHGRTSGPLFTRVDRWGNLAGPIVRNGREIGDPSGRMTGQAVGDVIRQRALAGGISGQWSGHSLRRGLATGMAKAGIDRRLIERQGGWKANSPAVSGYIDDAERWMYDALEGVL